MKNIIRKTFTYLILISIFSFITSFLTPENTYAADDCRYFLGLTSWDCNTGLTTSGDKNEEDIKSGVAVAAANIATDISVIAAYLVIGYVIYGGYLYIFSTGDTNKVAAGKKTLSQAFIGLAIVLSANIILNTIRIALGANFTENCTTGATNCVNPDTMITNLIGWFIGIAGVISAIFLVYGGISYITSSGDPNKTQKAKQIIIYALIGLAIVALATAITAFVSNMIREANKPTSTLNETLITKEIYENKVI